VFHISTKAPWTREEKAAVLANHFGVTTSEAVELFMNKKRREGVCHDDGRASVFSLA
jgi:hypothetical protein